MLLFQGTNWQGVVDAADSVIARGFSLAPDFADLHAGDGRNTPEDIFRVFFSPVEFQ